MFTEAASQLIINIDHIYIPCGNTSSYRATIGGKKYGK